MKRASPEVQRQPVHTRGAVNPSSAARVRPFVGNRHAGLLLREQPAGALIQLQPRPGRRSATVPGLAHRDVQAIQANLSSDPQAALNAIVAALAREGKIDATFLTDSGMTAVTDTSRMRPGHYGNTALSPGTGRPRPCRVDIGTDAFQTVSDLYTTVMHEWQHVLQFRRTTSASEPADELEARLWEVEHLRETGLSRNSAYLQTLPRQLAYWWGKLTAAEKTPLEARYDAARATIRQAVRRRGR